MDLSLIILDCILMTITILSSALFRAPLPWTTQPAVKPRIWPVSSSGSGSTRRCAVPAAKFSGIQFESFGAAPLATASVMCGYCFLSAGSGTESSCTYDVWSEGLDIRGRDSTLSVSPPESRHGTCITGARRTLSFCPPPVRIPLFRPSPRPRPRSPPAARRPPTAPATAPRRGPTVRRRRARA